MYRLLSSPFQAAHKSSVGQPTGKLGVALKSKVVSLKCERDAFFAMGLNYNCARR